MNKQGMNVLKIAIVIPVYNDWISLKELILHIDKVLSGRDVELSFLLVNDASTIESDLSVDFFKNQSAINSVEIIHMHCNLGHQRAIAIGLVEASRQKGFDAVVVMDADGEDRPEDLSEFLDQYKDKDTNGIIVAKRSKRSEGYLFRTGYSIYKIIFKILTGCSVNFGNFCLIPAGLLNRLIYMDSLWNHLPASILRSKLPIHILRTERGKRIQGKAKMNFGDLVLHGLSAISVYIDKVFLRTLALSMILFIVSIGGIAVVTAIRFYTDLAIPGWASNVAGSLFVIVILSIILSIFILFVVLANRSQITIIPAIDSERYVQKIQSVFKK